MAEMVFNVVFTGRARHALDVQDNGLGMSSHDWESSLISQAGCVAPIVRAAFGDFMEFMGQIVEFGQLRGWRRDCHDRPYSRGKVTWNTLP